MSDHKLVLFPVDAEAALPSVESLRSSLVAAGFLGAPTQVFGATHYEQGLHFDELVSNLRPHVAVILGPELKEQARVDSRSLCTIAFDGPEPDIRFLGGGNVEEPTCRNCRCSIEEWPDLVSAWYEAPDTHAWSCPGCGVAQKPWHLDWHRTNGFGRLAIDLWHLHPGQAAPTEALMSRLETITGAAWDWFHYRL